MHRIQVLAFKLVTYGKEKRKINSRARKKKVKKKIHGQHLQYLLTSSLIFPYCQGDIIIVWKNSYPPCEWGELG